jgi:hypothetical protein
VGLAPTGKRRLSTAHANNGLMHRSKKAPSLDHIVGALDPEMDIQPCELLVS